MAQETGQQASDREKTAPEPDDSRKPDQISDIKKPSWKYVARKTLREFSTDQCTDLAASLTYYGVLAIFPALLAFVSLIGLFGDAESTTRSLLQLAGGFVPADTLAALEEPIANLTKSDAAGFTFVIGVAGALWSASGFVGAFSRAMNRIYSIQEGRPFWKLRPVTLAVTVIAIVAMLVIAGLVLLGGPIAEAIGGSVGVGAAGLAIWNVARWPIIALIAVLVIAVLYYATPNIKQPRFRWMSVGAFVALLTWVVASAGFAFYAANFASYNETYGSIGGVIVFLLWLWISNNALLFGAELDAELERGRELQAGIAAEEQIQLPPRDTKKSDKAAEQHQADIDAGRAIRAQVDPISAANDARADRKAREHEIKEAEKAQARGSREEQEASLKKAGLALHVVSAAQTKGHVESAPGPKDGLPKK